jgi:hypothetical protein
VGHQVSFFVMQAGRLDLEAVIRAAGEICLRVGKSPSCEPIELATIAGWAAHSAAAAAPTSWCSARSSRVKLRAVPLWHPVPVRCERAA